MISSENLDTKSNDGDEVSVRELIFSLKNGYRYLLSQWLILMLFILVGGGLGFMYFLFSVPKYVASTTFVLEEGENGGRLGQIAGIASIAGVDLGARGGGIFEGDNILELYKSRRMIEKTLLSEIEFNGVKQLLIDRYIDINNLRESWKSRADLKDIQFNSSKMDIDGYQHSRLQDSILGSAVFEIVNNSLEVEKLEKNLSIIKADVISSDEFFAKVFNETLVKNVNDFYVQTKTKKSLDNVAILQQKADSVQAVMNGAIYAAAAVADATPNLNPTRQVQRAAPLQRSQFSAETNKLILSSLVQNLELAKMSLLKETPLIQVVDTPVYPLPKKELRKLKAIFLGAFLFGFFGFTYLLTKRVLKSFMTSN